MLKSLFSEVNHAWSNRVKSLFQLLYLGNWQVFTVVPNKLPLKPETANGIEQIAPEVDQTIQSKFWLFRAYAFTPLKRFLVDYKIAFSTLETSSIFHFFKCNKSVEVWISTFFSRVEKWFKINQNRFPHMLSGKVWSVMQGAALEGWS